MTCPKVGGAVGSVPLELKGSLTRSPWHPRGIHLGLDPGSRRWVTQHSVLWPGSNRISTKSCLASLDAVDGGLRMFPEVLDPCALDARVVRGCFDKVHEVDNVRVEAFL